MSYLSVISSRLSECACGIEATLPSRGHSARTGCLAWRLGVDRPPRCRHPASATLAQQRCRRPSRSGTAPPRVRRRKPKPPRGCPTQVSNEPRGGSSHGGSAGSRYSSSVPQQCRRIGTVVEPVRRSRQPGAREAGGWLRQAGDHGAWGRLRKPGHRPRREGGRRARRAVPARAPRHWAPAAPARAPAGGEERRGRRRGRMGG